jgi:hypothetical protein
MKRQLVASILLIPIVGLPQDVRHAPTLESCAADINLWTSEIPGLPTAALDQLRKGTKSITVRELSGRIVALNRCTESHPSLAKGPPGEEAPAELLVALYNGEIKQRLMDFLDRHGLGAKFIEEDKEGKR